MQQRTFHDYISYSSIIFKERKKVSYVVGADDGTNSKRPETAETGKPCQSTVIRGIADGDDRLWGSNLLNKTNNKHYWIILWIILHETYSNSSEEEFFYITIYHHNNVYHF
jgi:hypothetical protein